MSLSIRLCLLLPTPHGIDLALHRAWRAGVVLCGGSAGSLCWFTHAVSGFHDGPPRTLEGLGFLPWSNAVHYSDEPGRRDAYLDAVAGGIAPGYGVSDAAALHFVGTDLAEVVSSRPEARAQYVSADGAGGVNERDLPVRYLGETSLARAELAAAGEPPSQALAA